MAFSFSFSGDDIEDDANTAPQGATASPPPIASAFPVQGKPLLPPVHHALDQMLAAMPSKIAYGLLDVDLDGKGLVQIPRRELWDVRVQLMAEDDGPAQGDELEPGLGSHDVKTGIYEGGFKSWESSVDLVKVLAAEDFAESFAMGPVRIIELGCGTALPSVALFQWALTNRTRTQGLKEPAPLSLVLADYNPTVLQLVTLPNVLLAWALHQQSHDQGLQEAFASVEGELEINEHVGESFKLFLTSSNITLSFVSGGWSSDFVNLVYGDPSTPSNVNVGGSGTGHTLIMGAETIYSPFALTTFMNTLLAMLERERQEDAHRQAVAIVAAKRLYFGVGGSLDDFVDQIRGLGASVNMMREEAEGVRRGVVKCNLP